nr:MAG: wsv433-like protein [Marsupenaeus japonicus pemonivirus]
MVFFDGVQALVKKASRRIPKNQLSPDPTVKSFTSTETTEVLIREGELSDAKANRKRHARRCDQPIAKIQKLSTPDRRDHTAEADRDTLSDEGEVSPLSTAEDNIRNGLSLIVAGTRMRSEAVASHRRHCESMDIRNNKSFASIERALARPDATVGNHVYAVAKRDAADAAIRALDIKGKCRIVYNEDECRAFVEANRQVILREAVHTFNRRLSTKNGGLKTSVSSRRSGSSFYTTDIVLATTDTLLEREVPSVNRGAARELEDAGYRGRLPGPGAMQIRRPHATTVVRYTASGVHPAAVETNFGDGVYRANGKSENLQPEPLLPPEERRDLDLTRSEGSHIFTSLRRHDSSKPVLYAGGTFWQRTRDGKDWTNIVGWEENVHDTSAAKLLRLDPSKMAFVFPSSFRQLAAAVLAHFRSSVVKSTLPISSYKSGCRPLTGGAFRLINPARDTPAALRQFQAELDRCLDVLLASTRECAITESTLTVYRRKFRRYCLFCFSLYLLNRGLHPEHTSPLPFNFFNAFSYLYCHGIDMHSSSYLNTLCFLQNRIFRPMACDTGPASSFKRLVDLDYAFLKGGKAPLREFGSPAKTSVHTRTVVSFLAYAEMVLGALCHLLPTASGQIERRCKATIERLCDGIIFVFFTFVFFHRFGGVKRLTLRSALRLTLGQPHFHTSKAKASRLVNPSTVSSSSSAAAVADDDDDYEDETAAKCRLDEESTSLKGMSISHPHLLGLPYGIQARLGVPVDQLHPLVAKGNAGVASTIGPDDSRTALPVGIEYRLGLDLPAQPPPAEGRAAGELGMFENVVSDLLDGYYGSGFTLGVAEEVERAMSARDPYVKADQGGLTAVDLSLSPYGATRHPPLGKKGEGEGDPDTQGCPGGQFPREAVEFPIGRDLIEYWQASPMRLVFILVSDSEGRRNRYLSIGDVAMLALWIKRRVLVCDWTDLALGSHNYCWMGSILCRHLLLSDLANFGIWGDVKCDQRLDCTTNRMHKNGVRLPSESDRKKFAKYTSLTDRKGLAAIHATTNVRTRTHLGRVTATSWAVDAIRTVSSGDSALFTRLAVDVDTYHLAHTNSANFFPYYSSNCNSNDSENGLWGYIRRTSEKTAKAEIERGRFANLSRAGVANTDLAGAAIALMAEIDLGEREAANDVATKRHIAQRSAEFKSASRTSNRLRMARRDRVIAGVLAAAGGEQSRPCRRRHPHLLKELWGWPVTDRQSLLNGRYVRTLCRHTMFLAAAVPDSLLLYRFDSAASSVKLAVKRLCQHPHGRNGEETTADSRQRPHQESTKELTVREAKETLADRVVFTTDSTVNRYNPMGLASDDGERADLREHQIKTQMANALLKTCLRSAKSDNGHVRSTQGGQCGRRRRSNNRRRMGGDGCASLQSRLASAIAFTSDLAG